METLNTISQTPMKRRQIVKRRASTTQKKNMLRHRVIQRYYKVSENKILTISSFSLTMEFKKCSRGGVKLFFAGFTYTKKAEKTNRIRWECSQRKTASCKGAVTTSLPVVTGRKLSSRVCRDLNTLLDVRF